MAPRRPPWWHNGRGTGKSGREERATERKCGREERATERNGCQSGEVCDGRSLGNHVFLMVVSWCDSQLVLSQEENAEIQKANETRVGRSESVLKCDCQRMMDIEIVQSSPRSGSP